MWFLSIFWLAYISSWILFIYWEEKQNRQDFYLGYRKMRDFNKLKQIFNILMPAFVQERIRQGQRYIADEQGDVSILFCDIDNFDNMVQMFSGKELI